MSSYRPALIVAAILVIVVGMLLHFADDIIGYGPPPPANYLQAGGPESRDGDARCAEAAPNRNHFFWTGAGGDWIELGLGSGTRVFDSASPQRGDEHDIVLIHGVRPSDVRMMRFGAHLLICGTRVAFALTIFRQYCGGISQGEAWNNTIEEIVYSGASEIWIADELLDAAAGRTDIAALTRIDEKPEGKVALEKFGKFWKVRRFSEVLPSGWLSSIACRRDVINQATQGES